MFTNSMKISNRLTAALLRKIQIRNRHDGLTIGRTSFEHEVEERQAQAKRSVFIQSQNNAKSTNALADHCAKLGSVRNIFQTNVNGKAYLLVEFDDLAAANGVMQSVHHSGNHLFDGKIYAKGRFLTYTPKKGAEVMETAKVAIKQETNTTNEEKLFSAMREEASIDDQIRTFYKLNRLSDLSSRLRFLTALQIEDALSGVFHEAQVLPFGSSVNGFGRMQSDLDMILISNGNKVPANDLTALTFGHRDDASRNTIRNNLYVFSSIARHWLHGVTDVTTVLNARVPIIKYFHHLTQLECDVSMGNISGFQMSEILYTFGELDERVRPLLFYIRGWAKSFDVIATFPQMGVSNFMLTTLVIFFLQTLPKPILPPSDAFANLSDSFDSIYLTDISKLNFKSENTSSLAELLVQFFDYYVAFNYAKNGASITTGSIKANIAADSIFVYNPLEHGVNVCRNLSDSERNQFVEKCRVARDALAADKINAVELLEFYNRKGSNAKMDSFISSMTMSTKK